jgi:hypothetical protein
MADEIARGQHAQRLLDDPMMTEVLAAMRDEQIAAWLGSGVEQDTERESIWKFVKMIDRIKLHLEGIRDSGKVVAANAERQRQDRAFTARNTTG